MVFVQRLRKREIRREVSHGVRPAAQKMRNPEEASHGVRPAAQKTRNPERSEPWCSSSGSENAKSGEKRAMAVVQRFRKCEIWREASHGVRPAAQKTRNPERSEPWCSSSGSENAKSGEGRVIHTFTIKKPSLF